MAARGLAAASRVLSPIEIYNEQDIAARLELPVTSRLIKIERLRLGAGEPFALETCYLPAEQFGGLLQTGLLRGSLFYTLERDYGVKLSHADGVIDASIADHRSARKMGISHQLPLLRIRQVIYSSEDKATAFVLGLYRSDRHNLLIRRYR
jgi:DNA-binding GntR family transcriptional regulator